MSETRLVLDTNVIISAVLKPNGNEAWVVRYALQPPAALFVTDAILAEYAEVLARPKFKFGRDLVQKFLADLSAVAHRVEPTPGIAFCVKDPDDNAFVACADAASATYLVTGNIGDYPASMWKGTRILKAGDLRASLGAANDPGGALSN
ncbi:MAG: putative toxin-antitoxin system toxin component, PIN family [Reyranellaceae bacterium]